MVAQTPALKAVIDELERRKGNLPGLRTPQYIRAKIIDGKPRPEKGYSQHSYRNASDIMIKGWAKQKPIVDELMKMKSEGFPVGTVLDANYNADHYDHIHAEGSPTVTGNPYAPDSWNISKENGYTPGFTPGTGPGTSPGTDPGSSEPEKVSWWQVLTNPGEAIGNAVDTVFSQVVMRAVFGLVAAMAFSATVWILIIAWKGDDIVKVAGAVVGAKVPG